MTELEVQAIRLATLTERCLTHIGGRYCYVNHEHRVATESCTSATVLRRGAGRLVFDKPHILHMRRRYDKLYPAQEERLFGGYRVGLQSEIENLIGELKKKGFTFEGGVVNFPRVDIPTIEEVVKSEEDVRAAYNLKYWGEHRELIEKYNRENNCDLKLWECLTFDGRRNWFDSHPKFDNTQPDVYGFCVAIIQDDLTKEHKPVFVGDKLYSKTDGAEFTAGAIWAERLTEKVRYSFPYKDTSWNPLAKREFWLNGSQFPCPVVPGTEKPFAPRLFMGGEMFLFDSPGDRDRVRDAFREILRNARKQS